MATIHLFPNPYLCLDAKGRLAGACPEIEAVRASGGMPARRSIGAVLKMVDGTYNANEKEGRGPGGQLAPRAELMWMFDTIEPIKLVVDASQRASYVARDRAGDVFACVDPESVPLERLARARNLAVAKWIASYGPDAELDTAAWEKQFPLDAHVAELAKVYAARDAEADAKTTKAADEKRVSGDADRKAARQKTIEAVSAAAKKLAADKLAPASAPSSEPAAPTSTPSKPAKKE